MKTKQLLLTWPGCLFVNLIAAGCCWGFYSAFSDNDTRQIDAALRNWPFLLLIVLMAVGSWFVRI